jgi:acyl carrier protein
MVTTDELVPRIIDMLVDRIASKVDRIARKNDDGDLLNRLDSDSPLIGGQLPIDSLDLATIIVEMQEFTGRDPFKNGFSEFRTVGELATLFAG